MINVREARKLLNMTQKEVCNKADISEAFYSMIENGERRPSVKTAKKIARVLGFDWTLMYQDE